MKKIFSIAMAILIVFTAAMTAEGERLTTPEELGKIKKAADFINILCRSLLNLYPQ